MTDRKARQAGIGGEVLLLRCRKREREVMSRVGKMPLAVPKGRRRVDSRTTRSA